MRPYSVALGIALAAGLSTAALAKASDTAHAFLKKAMEGDNSEIMLGKLAAAQGGNDATKQYGQMLQDDHFMLLQKTEKVASNMNIPADDMPLAKAEKERDKLMDLHGAAFDREFAAYMVKDHRKDIADFRRASHMSGPVGHLAQEALPVLQKHLRKAEQLKS